MANCVQVLIEKQFFVMKLKSITVTVSEKFVFFKSNNFKSS